MNSEIPILRTHRLVLRPLVAEDAAALHTIFAEPGLLRYFPRTEAPPLARVADMIARQLAHWERHGFGWWAVEKRDGPRVVGWCGLQFLPETGEVEVAYLLGRAHWGRGLATEAARASLEYGFVDRRLDTIIALVHPDNAASRRVIEKLGMLFVDRSQYFGMELLRYRLGRSSYLRPDIRTGALTGAVLGDGGAAPAHRTHRYKPLDATGCWVLADALGDTSHTIIATHILRHGLCRAYVAGDPARFEGAIVQASAFPGEPSGYGSDPEVIWDLLQSVEGWFCILVATECASVLGRRMETELGVSVRYLDDVCCEMHGPAPEARDEDVRLLTIDDLDLLQAAPEELRASCYASTRELLSAGIVACAVVGGDVAATALTAARSRRYAEVGVYTHPDFRLRGYATAAAALVCQRVQACGQTPVWSAGAHNAASLRVAEKLGFVEVSRSRYVIVPERKPGARG